MQTKKNKSLLLLIVALTALLLFMCAIIVFSRPQSAARAEDGDGEQTVVATVGGVEYTDFNAALNAALNSDTLFLKADVAVSSQIDIADQLTLDLNGHILRLCSDGECPIYVNHSGEFTLSDSNTENLSHRYYIDEEQNGLWVFDDDKGDKIFSGGVITGGIGTYAGCIVVEGEFTKFEMAGGAICGNTSATYAGGVFVEAYSEFTMSGGTITGNIGGIGGVFVEYHSKFTMSGGAITGNTATDVGGGVYFYGSNSFDISGTPKITGNRLYSEENGYSDNNVAVRRDEKITVTGALTDGAKIGVNKIGEVATGYTYNGGDKPSKYFISDDPNYCVTLKDAALGTVSIGETEHAFETGGVCIHCGKTADLFWGVDGDGVLTLSSYKSSAAPNFYERIGYNNSDTGTAPNWVNYMNELTEVTVDRYAYAPEVVSEWFCIYNEPSNLTTVNLTNLDTSCVTDMRYMFAECSSLTTLDLSGFDTSNVTSMDGMFYDCGSLTSLDLSGFNTSNVTEMHEMFEGCESLTTLDLSSFDTANVWDMSQMFRNCSSLTTLDLSDFDTSNVTDMYTMFRGCSSLTALDLTGFDTSNVTDMHRMFRDCESLTSLDLSGFDTSNVEDMESMFRGCSSLTAIDLSSFDTANVEDMSAMFEGCESLTSLDLSSFDTANVWNMDEMFSCCYELTELDISSFDIENLEDAMDILIGCDSLAVIYTPAKIREWGIELPNEDDWWNDTRKEMIVMGEDDEYNRFKSADAASVIYRHAGHTDGETVRENEVAADCTHEGSYDAVVYCTVCEEEVSRENKEIPKTAHTEVSADRIQPTCTETGRTEGKYCFDCGETLEGLEVIPVKGHSYGEWTTTKKATCGEEGSKTRVCANDANHTETEPISAKGHSYGEWSVYKEATVTEEGEERRVCANDPTHYESRPIEKLTDTQPPEQQTKPAEPEAPDTGHGAGAISGIVIGILVFVGLLAAFAVIVCRERRESD